MLSRPNQYLKLFITIAISLALTACAAPRPNLAIPSTPPPPLALKSQPRVALVLGGGGARGMAHVGVLKVLQEEQIPIDLIVGTSAGSIVGALYADKVNAYKVQHVLMETGLGDLLDITPSLQGPVSGYGLQNFLLHHLRARTFGQLKIPLVAISTDLKTGQTVAISSGPIAPAINASASVPPIFQPVHLYGHTLIDGGFVDLVPVDVAKHYAPEVIIAVNIVPDIPRQMPTGKLGVYDRAYVLSDARFANFNEAGADIVLHPYVGQAGLFDSSDKQPLFKAGEMAAQRALPQICALLKAKNIPSKCS